jgi:hypothetical protein
LVALRDVDEEKDEMTLEELLTALRQRLLTAWEKGDQKELHVLTIVFGTLREEIQASKNDELIGILVALEDSARDAYVGLKSKGEVPTTAAIRNALRSKEDS